MNRIDDIFRSMNERALISAQVAAHRDFTQADVFFKLAFEKAQRIDALKQRFAGRRIERIFCSSHAFVEALRIPGVELVQLPRDYFQRALGDDLPQMLDELSGGIVLVNNNEFSIGESHAGIARLFGHADDTVFLGWDWDNHHWMDASLRLAAYSDLYFPAHGENMYLLSRFNALTCGPVPCATVQWSRPFLRSSLPLMLETRRSDEPLGMHFFYSAFAVRNQTVVTVGKHCPHVRFADRAYQVKSLEDRLAEWIAHKTHWIVPVLNDLPVRIFDALCTGGVPILPEAMRFLAPIDALPREHVVFYSARDVLEPLAVAARARALFDDGGPAGIVARHELGVTLHHGVERLGRMLRMAQERLGFLPLID